MTSKRLTRGVLIAGGVAFAVGAAATASAQSPPLVRAGVVARESTARVGNLVLVGVIVAGDRSMALFRDSAAGSGASEMVPVGGSLAGHRIVDIQVDRVTVETPSGERVAVRLGAGTGTGEILAQPAEREPAETVQPNRSRRMERRRERARVTAERAAAGLPVDPAADLPE